jgi:hypothetical protein
MRLQHGQLVALALLGLACGPPKLAGDVDTGDVDAEEETSGGDAGDSSTTSSSTETSTADSGATLTFVPVVEDAIGPIGCDSFEQDCIEGEKCVPYASTGTYWDGNMCVPVMGEQPAGEPCIYSGKVESTDDCDATSFCWDVQDVEGELVGTCRPICTGTEDSPECPEGSQCLLASDGVIFLCISTCDPILQDCEEGFACYWGNTAFNCLLSTQGIPTGEPCGFIDDCAGGNNCTSGELLPSCLGSACCSPFCPLGVGDQACEVLPGTTCAPFFEEGAAPPGYEDVGVCLVPP